MLRQIRCLLIAGLLFVIVPWTPDAAHGQDDEDDTPAPPALTAPTGVSIGASIGSLNVAWSRGPGTNVAVDGYAVYFWETHQPGWEWQRIRVLDGTRVTLTDLRPGVEYTVGVCAGARQVIEGVHRRFGDWFLSGFSVHVSAVCLPEYRLRLVHGFLGRADQSARVLIDISRRRDGTSQWLTERFLVESGQRIGQTVMVADAGFVPFGTQWQLDAVELFDHRRAGRIVRTAPFLDEDDEPLTDLRGDELRLPMPDRGERIPTVRATISARPWFPGGDRRVRVLIQGE